VELTRVRVQTIVWEEPPPLLVSSLLLLPLLQPIPIAKTRTKAIIDASHPPLLVVCRVNSKKNPYLSFENWGLFFGH
jgi:hypothetical protein